MRLIHTFNDPQMGQQFSNFLNAQGIDHNLEVATSTDWGSDDYGTIKSNLWIIDEDRTLEAVAHLEKFKADPYSSDFNAPPQPEPLPVIEPEILEKQKETPPPPPRRDSQSPITTYILFICGILFILSQLTRPPREPIPVGIPPTPVYTSSVNKELMFDYPETYVLVDKVIELYGADSLENPNQLPSEGQFLLQKALKTPFWNGIYDDIVTYVREPNAPLNINGTPLFEKIKQGEVWRIFTPALLHFDIFHIFFNMIWLLILGRQMETRMGPLCYIMFILIAAVFSNTAQYLMSGSNFIGFSGVICAMIAYIWVRQQRAAWEGYQLHRSSLIFVSVFVLAIFGLQVISFLLEVTGNSPLFGGIANTAHLTGALIGYIMGRYNLLGFS